MYIKNYIYHPNSVIGKGSSCLVYKGYNIHSDKTVAIKKVQKNQCRTEDIVRLKSEVILVQSLNHPGIVKIIEFIETINHFYIIMEYCNAGSLFFFKTHNSTHFTNSDNMSEFIDQLLSIMRYLHARNIMHRDIKPQNILVVKNSDANCPFTFKLSDFNYATRVYDKELKSSICGTPLYMSPELLTQTRYTNKSDLWSIGLVLYEIAYGNHPFAGATDIIEIKRMAASKASFKYNDNVIDPYFNQLMRKLLTSNVNERIDWVDLFKYHSGVEDGSLLMELEQQHRECRQPDFSEISKNTNKLTKIILKIPNVIRHIYNNANNAIYSSD